MILKDSLGILCTPYSHSLLWLHAELSEIPEKEPEAGGNITEKWKTINKEFFVFWAYCPDNEIFKIYILHALSVFLNGLQCLKNNIKNQGDWEGTQKYINLIEILVQIQSEIKNQKSRRRYKWQDLQNLIAMNGVEKLRQVHFRAPITGMDINFAGQVGVRHETSCNLPDKRKKHNWIWL